MKFARPRIVQESKGGFKKQGKDEVDKSAWMIDSHVLGHKVRYLVTIFISLSLSMFLLISIETILPPLTV
nr:hypothetical protein [Candidatus Njordarchaeota archaeon]